MRLWLLIATIFACALVTFACVREKDSSFELRLHRGASCTDVPISCAKVLNLTLDHAEPRSWRIAISATGAGARFGELDLPNEGPGRFFVQGSSLGLGPIFSGTSQTITFDTRDAAADITFECRLPPPCFYETAPPVTPTPFVVTADLVLGKADFVSCNNATNGVDESFELSEPDGLERFDGKLWVADANYNRAAVWSTAAFVSGAQLTFAVQQDNRTNTGDGGDSNSANEPRDVLLAAALRLMIDTDNNRIGRNTSIPTTDAGSPNEDDYDTTIGQNNPGSGNGANAGGLDEDSLSAPWSAVIIGSSLWVADTNNHRVLRYALADIAANRPAANLVLGQTLFTTATPGSGAGMSSPRHLATDGTRLYVADSGNHRVLVFTNLDSLANGAPASLVIGQTSIDGNTAGAGAEGLNAPRGVAADANRVVIADSGNHRVLVFTPPPIANGASAAQVLGQPDFAGTTPNVGGANGNCPDVATCNGVGETTLPTATSMSRPGAVFVEGATLWVSDTCNSRVLRYREGS